MINNQNFIFSQQFNKKDAIGLIHKVYITKYITTREHLASTKTKSEVRGGGRKPWKQKGTGNARAGSIRSPLWRGGGVIFGPRPRVVLKKINKKEYLLSLIYALLLKLNSNNLFLFNELEELFLNFNKTKEVINFLNKNNIKLNKKLLIIVSLENYIKIQSISKNIHNILCIPSNKLNLQHLINFENVLLSTNTLNQLITIV